MATPGNTLSVLAVLNDQLSGPLAKIGLIAKDVSTAFHDFARPLQASERAVSQMVKNISALGAPSKAASANIQRVAAAASALGAAGTRMATQLNRGTRSVVGVGSAASTAAGRVQRLSGALFGLGQSATVIGIGRITSLLAGIGGFLSISLATRQFKSLVTSSIEFNKNIEQAQLGVAALILATSEIRDAFGNTVSSGQGLVIAQKEAVRQTEKLRLEARRTAATFDQLAEAFQTAIAPGVQAGLNLDQIRKFTVQISQAAAAIGLSQNQLAEEIRSILQGTIQVRTTRIATALGITNEDIRLAKQAGDLADFLNRKFSAFTTAGSEALNTFNALFTNALDAIRRLLGAGGLEFFQELKDILRSIEDFALDENLRIDPQVVLAVREIFDILSDLKNEALAFVNAFTIDEIVRAFRVLSEIVAGIVEGAIDGFQTAFNVISKIIPVLKGIAEGILGRDTVDTDNIREVARLLTGWLVALANIQIALTILAAPVRIFINLIKPIGPLLVAAAVAAARFVGTFVGGGIITTATANISALTAATGAIPVATAAAARGITSLFAVVLPVLTRIAVLVGGLIAAYFIGKTIWGYIFGDGGETGRVRRAITDINKQLGEMDQRLRAIVGTIGQVTAGDSWEALAKLLFDATSNVNELQSEVDKLKASIAEKTKARGQFAGPLSVSFPSLFDNLPDDLRTLQELLIVLENAKRKQEEIGKAIARVSDQAGRAKIIEALDIGPAIDRGTKDLERFGEKLQDLQQDLRKVQDEFEVSVAQQGVDTSIGKLIEEQIRGAQKLRDVQKEFNDQIKIENVLLQESQAILASVQLAIKFFPSLGTQILDAEGFQRDFLQVTDELEKIEVKIREVNAQIGIKPKEFVDQRLKELDAEKKIAEEKRDQIISSRQLADIGELANTLAEKKVLAERDIAQSQRRVNKLTDERAEAERLIQEAIELRIKLIGNTEAAAIRAATEEVMRKTRLVQEEVEAQRQLNLELARGTEETRLTNTIEFEFDRAKLQAELQRSLSDIEQAIARAQEKLIQPGITDAQVESLRNQINALQEQRIAQLEKHRVELDKLTIAYHNAVDAQYRRIQASHLEAEAEVELLRVQFEAEAKARAAGESPELVRLRGELAAEEKRLEQLRGRRSEALARITAAGSELTRAEATGDPAQIQEATGLLLQQETIYISINGQILQAQGNVRGLTDELEKSTDVTAAFSDGFGRAVDALADFGAAGAQVANLIASAVDEMVDTIFDASRSWEDFATNFGKAIAKMAAQLIIFNALKAAGLGANTGGQAVLLNRGGPAIPFDRGGKVPGPRVNRDIIDAKLTPYEWVIPVPAVDYYGNAVMEAIRRRLIPRELFEGLRLPRPKLTRSGRYFQTGGQAVAVPGGSTTVNNRSTAFQGGGAPAVSPLSNDQMARLLAQNAPGFFRFLRNNRQQANLALGTSPRGTL